jgi:hypothetical protein
VGDDSHEDPRQHLYLGVSRRKSMIIFVAVLLAAENKLFSAACHWPPKIKVYFRLIFSGGQEPLKISLKSPKKAYFRRDLFSGVPGRQK